MSGQSDAESTVRKRLAEIVAEATELRVVTDLPDPGSDPKHVLESLGQTRRRLDRVEELLRSALLVRGEVRRMLTIERAAHEDRYDQILTQLRKQRSGPVSRDADTYLSAKERHAEANLATVESRRELLSTQDFADYCDEAVELLRLMHRGLEGIRSDHLTVLRAVQFESTLDR